jgi:serine/threonine protein kinase
MAVRRFFRGAVEWDRLESVFRELARRYDEPVVHVEFLEADNWLSTPCVVNHRWFLKVISRQNSLVHALFTGARNIGAFSSGTEGFFEHFGTPIDMAEHELEATKRMREIGVNAPKPIEAFEVDGLGVVVMEYLADLTPLDEFDPEHVADLAPDLFEALATMHEHRLAHGDLRAENVLVRDSQLYFIDATNVREDGIDGARAYDVACALGVLVPVIGARSAVEAALDFYTAEELLEAREFLDFVNIRPDHDFDGATVKGEIEKRAT